jgi:hypothetical protein
MMSLSEEVKNKERVPMSALIHVGDERPFPSAPRSSSPERASTSSPIADPRNQNAGSPDVSPENESLIVDTRGDLSPAEMVERKLFSLLKGRMVPLSHVRMSGLPRNRGLS